MKHYTFKVICSFSMQYTFTEDEVETDNDVGESCFEPTYTAQQRLAGELRELIGNHYALNDDIEICAESDDLLGVDDDSS